MPLQSESISLTAAITKESLCPSIIRADTLLAREMKMSTADKKHGGDGAIYIFLKNKKKIKE